MTDAEEIAQLRRLYKEALETLALRTRERDALNDALHQAMQFTLADVRGHWFTQGGKAQFGALEAGSESADAVVANMLRLVRAVVDARTRERDEARQDIEKWKALALGSSDAHQETRITLGLAHSEFAALQQAIGQIVARLRDRRDIFTQRDVDRLVGELAALVVPRVPQEKP